MTSKPHPQILNQPLQITNANVIFNKLPFHKLNLLFITPRFTQLIQI